MSRYNDNVPFVWIGAVLIILIGICFWIVAHDRQQTRDEIKSCYERGGQPIVAGHQYTNDVYCVIQKEGP